MLIFPLKKEWYEKIKSGEKTIEYREVKDYWTSRLISAFMQATDCKNELHSDLLDFYIREDFVGAFEIFYDEVKKNRLTINSECKLRLGYTKKYMVAKITEIEIIDGKDTDLHIDKPVYAIHLADVAELHNYNKVWYDESESKFRAEHGGKLYESSDGERWKEQNQNA